MNGVKEYIFPVYDVDADEYKEYIGFIRSKPELIRCKDCKYWNGAGKFCDYEMSGLEEDYCSWAEPKEAE